MHTDIRLMAYIHSDIGLVTHLYTYILYILILTLDIKLFFIQLKLIVFNDNSSIILIYKITIDITIYFCIYNPGIFIKIIQYFSHL